VVPTAYDLLVGQLASLQVAEVPLIEVPKDPGDSVAWATKATARAFRASAGTVRAPRLDSYAWRAAHASTPRRPARAGSTMA